MTRHTRLCAICGVREAGRVTELDEREVPACGPCVEEHPRQGRFVFGEPDGARHGNSSLGDGNRKARGRAGR